VGIATCLRLFCDVRLAQQAIEVEWPSEHLRRAFERAGPLFSGSIPIKLYSISVRIAQIERFTDSVIGGAFKWNFCLDETAQCVGEFLPRWIKNRQMIKASGARRWWRPTGAFPGVQTDVMVIASSREKRYFLSVPLRDLKAENVPIKVERTFQVGHLQMNVANSDLWVKRASIGRSRELLPHRL
jgi:hypothetical protein